MLKLVIALALIGAATLLFIRRTRDWLGEQLKEVSDLLVIFLLRSTSRFGSALTEDGKAEQNLWREQRLRNLRGLALRSREKWENKTK